MGSAAYIARAKLEARLGFIGVNDEYTNRLPPDRDPIVKPCQFFAARFVGDVATPIISVLAPLEIGAIVDRRRKTASIRCSWRARTDPKAVIVCFLPRIVVRRDTLPTLLTSLVHARTSPRTLARINLRRRAGERGERTCKAAAILFVS